MAASDVGTYQTKEHGCHVAPRPELDAETDLGDEIESEERGVKGIPTKSWNVLQLCQDDVASLQSAKTWVAKERRVAVVASGIVGSEDARHIVVRHRRHGDRGRGRCLCICTCIYILDKNEKKEKKEEGREKREEDRDEGCELGRSQEGILALYLHCQ
jgi:hypothetical protein